MACGANNSTSYDLSSNGYDATFFASDFTMELAISGNSMELKINDVVVNTLTSSLLTSNTRWGFVIGEGNATGTDITLDDIQLYTGIAPASLRSTYLAVVSGGSLYSGTPSGVAITIGGSSIVHSTRLPIGTQEAFQKLYLCDGLTTGYQVFNPATNTVSKWEATAHFLPTEGEGTIYDITGVNTSNETFTVAEDLSSLADGDYFIVAGSTGNDGWYIVASVSGSGPTTITVDQNITDATVDGTIQLATKGCTMIALYRGRVIMAGLQTAPHNWFMSAVNNPFDWDYNPDIVSATQAVAGSSTNAGEIGDVITALIPYGDDTLIFGCDHTIWILRGDPATGGVIDALSYQTGVAGPEAFAFDPEGNLYFVGSGTLWRLARGTSELQSLSGNRMDTTFSNMNYATHHIRLIWDSVLSGLHIFVTATSEPTAGDEPTHYFWGQRSDGFWRDEYPVSMGPTAVFLYDADDPNDRAILIGGWDSYVRSTDASATNDDGTAIDSYILYPPIVAGGPLNNSRVNRIMATLDSASDDVTLSAYAEDTPQRVIEFATSSDVAVNITAVSIANKTFTVAEDWSERIAGDHLLVAGSTGNDGDYTLASLTGTGPTVLTVNETIVHATANGTIQYKDRVKFTRTLAAGRTTVLNRIAGNAVLLKLANSTAGETWAIENLIANVDAIGLTRKNQL